MVEPRRRFIAATLAIGGALVAGCTSRDPAPTGGPLAGIRVRTDLGALRKTFPRLGQMVSAHWQKRVVGDFWVPGPSDTLIQALAVLQDSDLASLSAGYVWEEPPVEDWGDRMSEELRPFAPASAEWRHNSDFEIEAQAPYFMGGSVYLDLRSGTVYLDVFTS